MKKRVAPFLMSLACLGALVACGGVNAPSSQQSADPASGESTNPIIEDTYTDIDSLNLESGEYMVADVIYAFDNANKKMKSSKYADYDSYKNKTGTVLYDGSVRFVKVHSSFLGTFDAAYFEIDGTIYLLYRDAKESLRLSTRKGGVWSSSGAVVVSDIPLFTMGRYVSEKQTQSKVNPDGSGIYDSQGNAVKEDFYLFLDLSETKASIFLGSDATTHAETPLHSVENYTVLFVSGRLRIKIPHKDGDFDCSLTSYSETEIKFVNSMEKKGDYSCSGTFTKTLQ